MYLLPKNVKKSPNIIKTTPNSSTKSSKNVHSLAKDLEMHPIKINNSDYEQANIILAILAYDQREYAVYKNGDLFNLPA